MRPRTSSAATQSRHANTSSRQGPPLSSRNSKPLRQNVTLEQHTDDSESYWVTVGQAAEILDLSVQRVKQLLDEDRLPYLLPRFGVRLMRRQQIDVVANARQSRELQTGNS